ncbi:putative MFS transporter [Aspergillus affinis]|uniref:putative MFS transporter n=1 Tax=Aspergillus affinis TaxID=1070780 RepID=UPI0022FEC2B0|nr:MFS general substrate transporter [Aspergillus affinis]KAI9037135.1 MFS general substrate transporter [Aspergillus affinis]
MTLRRLLMAPDFLHTDANIVHTDIKTDNLILNIEDSRMLDDFASAELDDPSPRKKVDSFPTIYKSRRFRPLVKEKGYGLPTLCDFGEARIGNVHEFGPFVQPQIYRAPEIIIEMPWGSAIDIWNVGCLYIWDLFEGEHLFADIFDTKGGHDPFKHLALMVALIGDPPSEFVKCSETTEQCFDSRGKKEAFGFKSSQVGLTEFLSFPPPPLHPGTFLFPYHCPPPPLLSSSRFQLSERISIMSSSNLPPSALERQDTSKSAARDSFHDDIGKPGASAPGVVEDVVEVVDHKAERALCLRFDLRLLPVLAVMYLFNALDKGNLGNAQTDGLSDDLGFKSNEYNLLLSIFFVPYVIFAPPFAMLGKRFSPARVLPILMFSFGCFTLLSSATKNFGGIFALRWFLGMSEAAFFPLVIYYLTTFYRRGELARRLAIFYAASNIANAFSGLIAFGVFQIKNSSIPNWRYLFIIEGAVTVLFAIFAFWYLPRSASEAKFLSAEEKALAFHRIQVDSSAVVNEQFRFREAIAIFKHPSTYFFLGIEICLGVPLQGVALFMPQIIQRLGFSTVKTNLYTVAPNVTGAVMLLVLAFASDAARLRSPFIVLGFLFTFTGFMIYASIDDVEGKIQVAYFATFMMTWGTSAPSVLLSTWYNNNIAHEGRRVLLTSIGVPLANLMGLVSSNVFRTQDKPKYMPALITVAAFGATGAALAASLGLFMWFDNKRRDRRSGQTVRAQDVPTERLRDGPACEEFRWFL